MTSRRSLLKALALAAGGAAIASKAVSAIPTPKCNKNASADVYSTQDGARYHVSYRDLDDLAQRDAEERAGLRERIWNLHKDLPHYTEEELMRP